MIVETAGDSYKLILQFGMTGALRYGQRAELTGEEKKYARLIVEFQNGGELLWINVRKLGKIYFVRDLNDVGILKTMGPEPLELTQDQFLELLQKHATKNIKSFLMDQSDIAGIGNEYSNEILFQAGIDPHHTIDSLSEKKRRDLFQVMERVLEQGIATKPGPLPDDWLTAHKNRMDCPKDSNQRLTKETIAGRSAVFCHQCQH